MRGFIPDDCNILLKYGLVYLLNDIIENEELPFKCQWQKIVNSTSGNSELNSWRKRIPTDPDFERFKQMHTSVSPAFVWAFPSNRQALKIAHIVTNIWIQPKTEAASVFLRWNNTSPIKQFTFYLTV